jgi:predicted nucleotidyltransferase
MAIPTTEVQQQIIERVLQAQLERPQFLQQMQQRQEQGLAVAKQIAQRLKIEFGVQKVVLFGSLLHPEDMDFESDIDLAVWGLPTQKLYQVGGIIEEGHNFPVDLVLIEQAKPYIQKAIARGVEL